MTYKEFNHDISTGGFQLQPPDEGDIPFKQTQKFVLIQSFSQVLFDELEEYPEFQNIVANLVLEIKNLGEWLQDAERILCKIKAKSVIPEVAIDGYFAAKNPPIENEEPKKSFLEL